MPRGRKPAEPDKRHRLPSPKVLGKKRAADKPLSPGEQKFVTEFIRTRSLKEAALAAWPGLSQSTASSYGCNMMRIPAIAAAVRAELEVIRQEARIEAADVVRELALIAFADPRRLLDEHGDLIPLHQLPESIARSIASVRFTPTNGVEVKFWDKNTALEKLARHLGLFELDNKQQAANAISAALALIDGRTASLLEQAPAEVANGVQ